ncbi:MAG: hypothetical protein ABSH24_12020 [Bryobacteraceae bacterium]|jgi:hypothetical protein
MSVCARIPAFFAMGALGLCQTGIYEHTPNTRARLSGSETIAGYRLSPDARTILGADSAAGQVLVRLPSVHRKAVPELLGMLQHAADIELFLGWVDPESKPGDFAHHIEIFRGGRGTQAALVHDLTLLGAPGMAVGFFQPPDARDAPAVLIDIQGGAYWGTTYLLAPDRQSAIKLFTSSDYEFADLDRDGVYELIAWNRRPFDMRCAFGIFAVRFYPEVFVRAGAGYRQIWPPQDWPAPDGRLVDRFRKHEKDGVPWEANFQIVAGFADLKGDGGAELVVLQDRLREKPAQALAVYRLESRSFHLVAQTPLPPQSIAYLLDGIRDSSEGKEILVRTATPAKCAAGGDPEERGTADVPYMFRGDRLMPAEPPKRRVP